MKSFFEIVLEEARERKEYFDNYLTYVREIKNRAEKILKEVKVFVFGSVVHGDYTPMSDIDILIVSNDVPENIIEQARIKVLLTEGFKPGIFQIHLVKPDDYEKWYKNFIKDKIQI
mgnify:CR=1 FL=1